MHLVLSPHHQGAAARLRRSLSGRRPRLRRSKRQTESDQPVHTQQPRAGAQTRDRQCAERILRRHRQRGGLVESIIHFAPYTGWVYPNETVFEWSVLVAGAFTVSSLYQVFGFERLKPVAHLALLTSLSFMIFVPTPLLLHLGHAERAFNSTITPH